MQLGRYEILGELGRGAMGTVYRARDPVIGRIVAIKTINASDLSPADEEGYRRRFSCEAQAAGRLSHSGIVTIYDVGEAEGTKTPYIVMEYIAGKTLESVVAGAPGSLPLATTLDLVKQVADALDYAHAEGIVHRDIKPANILLSPQGKARITDFGVARLRQTQMTVAGELLGTPSYMSPEQVQGQHADGRADLFSLGVILYWMLTSQKPFPGRELTEVMFKILYKDAPSVTEVNPLLPVEFDYVLARALAKDPGCRYQTGKEFAEDLADLQQGRQPRSQAGTSEPSSVLDRTVRIKYGERAVDQTVIAGKTVPVETPQGFPVPQAPSAVVTVDWERIAGYSKRASLTALSWSILAGRQTVSLARTLPASSRAAGQLARRAWQWTGTLSRQAQVALAAAAVVPVGVLVIWLSFALAPKATLQISLNYNFREGEVSVWVDDDLVIESALVGRETRRLRVFRRIEGSSLENVVVAAGQHVIRVRVVAPLEGYDETQEMEAEFAKGEERTLAVRCDLRRGFLDLSLR